MSKNIVPCGGFELGDRLEISNNKLSLANGFSVILSSDGYARFCDIKYYNEILAKTQKIVEEKVIESGIENEEEIERLAVQVAYEVAESYSTPIEKIFEMCANLYPVYFAIEGTVYTLCNYNFPNYISLSSFRIAGYSSGSFWITYRQYSISGDGKVTEIASGKFEPTSAQIIEP